MNHQQHSVGVIASREDWNAFAKKTTQCSVIEVRVDMLEQDHASTISEALDLPGIKKLLTLRGTAEKGLCEGAPDERWEQMYPLIHKADFFDFEIQSLSPALASTIREQKGTALMVGSYHNFDACPSKEELRQITETGLKLGCDIIKMAIQMHQLQDFETLASLIKEYPDTKFSLMGMGELGAVSRHYFINQGSVLNYGYLAGDNKAVVPGQLPTEIIQQLISAQA